MKIEIIRLVGVALGLFAAGILHSASALKILASFNETNGTFPNAALLQGSDHNFYGTTFSGGKGHHGTVFRMTPTGHLSTVVAFGLVNGGQPGNGVVLATNGLLFGTASLVTNSPYGSIFSVTPQGKYNNIHVFNGSDGIGGSELLLGTDGNLYGLTSAGGENGFGTMFRMSTGGTFATLYSFNGYDGGYNKFKLVNGSDGYFYGTTMGGGSTLNTTFSPFLVNGGAGTVFKMTPDGNLVWSVSFNGYDGACPSGSLVEGMDGNFYGTTWFGGTNWPAQNGGTIFKVTPDGAISSLYSFDDHLDVQDSNLDGVNPLSLVKAKDGTLYGVTFVGGAYGDGTVFKMTTNGSLITLYAFGTITNVNGYSLDGFGSKYLTVGNDGGIYGTSDYGGVYDNDGNDGLGAAFRLSVVRPIIQVTHQHQSNTVETNWISVSGKTRGDVKDVFYQSNGGEWLEATTFDNWTNWTANIPLSIGRNVIKTYALDNFEDCSLTNTLRVLRVFPAIGK